MRARITWWAGIGAAGAGLALALAGRWPVAAGCFAASAALLWLSGAWVLPWTRDAYVRRVGRAWTDWAIEAQWAYDRFTRPPSRHLNGLDRLSPPSEFEDAHARLMALRDEAERLNRDGSARHAERASHSVAAQLAFAETRDRLAATATTDAQRRYAATLDELLNERLAHYAATTRKAEQAAEKAVRILARMRVPAAAAREHAELLEASRSHLDAMREFHAAVSQSRDPGRAAAAAGRLDRAEEQLVSAGAAVSDELVPRDA
jgi:hypothetical protein